MSINPIKTDFSERGITSLKKEQLSTDETILKVTIKQFTTAEFAQLPDSRKIEFQVKETAMQQISEQSPPDFDTCLRISFKANCY